MEGDIIREAADVVNPAPTVTPINTTFVSANYDPYLAADGTTSDGVIKSLQKRVSRMDNKETEVSMVGEEILG